MVHSGTHHIYLNTQFSQGGGIFVRVGFRLEKILDPLPVPHL